MSSSLSFSAPLSIHPPAIVHVSPIPISPTCHRNTNDYDDRNDNLSDDGDDDCSDLSSAPNSLGRDTTGSGGGGGNSCCGSDDDDDDSNHNDTDLNERIAAAMIEHQKNTIQIQRQNSELGRQSRKTRLRRTSFQQYHHTAHPATHDHSLDDDNYDNEDNINNNPTVVMTLRGVDLSQDSRDIPNSNMNHSNHRSLEEKKCDASMESHISKNTDHDFDDVDDMLLLRPKTKTKITSKHPPPPRDFTLLNESHCRTIPAFTTTEDDVESTNNHTNMPDDGDDLPLILIPRRLHPPTSTTSNMTATSAATPLESPSWTIHHNNTQTMDDQSFSPMDEMDELDFRVKSNGTMPQSQQPYISETDALDTLMPPQEVAVIHNEGEHSEPPPYDEMTPPSFENNHRPPLLWRESESYDDDIDLYMAPTDEALDVNQHSSELTTPATHIGDRDVPLKYWPDDDPNSPIPLDETIMDQSLIAENDVPAISPVPNYCRQSFHSVDTLLDRQGTSSSLYGKDAENAIAVEDFMTETTTFDLEETNVLNISIDSNDSSVGPIGPLIRLEQHQPLLHSIDDISSSDETPLAGNGPLATRVHRNRTYREPKLHGYWKDQQQQQQKQQQQKTSRRKRALRHRKVIHPDNAISNSPTYQPNENSIDHVLPPLIIDPEQLRSIGITAILAVCNGIGSLFLANQESSSSDSPRDKPAERYKLLSDDGNAIKRRTKDSSKGRKVKLEPEEMSPSDQTGNTSTSDVTPVYFEDALQRSIDAEIRAGDKRIATSSISVQPKHDLLDHPFADFAVSDLETIDNRVVNPYSMQRTVSVPVTTTTTPQYRDNTDRFWLEKIRAVKCSSQQQQMDDANKPLDAILESSKAGLSERKSSREKKHWLRSVTSIDRDATIPDDESFPLEYANGKRTVGKRKIIPAAAKRIAALRDSKNKGANDPKDHSHPDANPPLYSPAILSFDGRDGALSPISPIIQTNTRSDESPIVHTPLAEPPALRRLNKSLDFDESFGADFSAKHLEIEEPPSLSRPTPTVLTMSQAEFSQDPEGDIPAITIKSSTVPKHNMEVSTSISNNEPKPSADRSPMSDFLLMRLQATSSSDMSSLRPMERSGSPYDDSDCSSTGELLSSLDGLVKDLDGLATTRRVERQLISDSTTSETLLFPESYVPPGISIVEDFVEHKFLDVALVGMPELVDSLNSDIGIPRGDIMISLLKSDKGEPTWISRVDEAIWRGRTMRHQFETLSVHMRHPESSIVPLRRRTSFCVDVDDGRVVVGIDKVVETQQAADELLTRNEFDDALAMYEAISWSYEQHMDGMESSDDRMEQMKGFVATAQYNVGIIHMLQGEHDDALEYFEQSTLLYSTSLDVGHTMHVSSLVKTAICHFAMEDYTTAYSELELALSLSRDGIHTLSDHRQIAEVLNNLGSLSYMGGEIERSMLFFRESINILTRAVDFATYSDSKLDSHSTTLALSIAKSNVAFLSLTFYRDVLESVTMFESVIKDQQLLLRDADVTLLATLEHLAAANLLAGDKSKALQLLRRVLRMQSEACCGNNHNEKGESNSMCERTRHKIAVLEQSDSEGFETIHKDSSCSVTTATGNNNTILPILETSRESSNSRSRGNNNSSTGSSSNNNNNISSSSHSNMDKDDSSPNTSMTNTLKAWRESHAITEESFLTDRVII